MPALRRGRGDRRRNQSRLRLHRRIRGHHDHVVRARARDLRSAHPGWPRSCAGRPSCGIVLVDRLHCRRGHHRGIRSGGAAARRGRARRHVRKRRRVASSRGSSSRWRRGCSSPSGSSRPSHSRSSSSGSSAPTRGRPRSWVQLPLAWIGDAIAGVYGLAVALAISTCLGLVLVLRILGAARVAPRGARGHGGGRIRSRDGVLRPAVAPARARCRGAHRRGALRHGAARDATGGPSRSGWSYLGRCRSVVWPARTCLPAVARLFEKQWRERRQSDDQRNDDAIAVRRKEAGHLLRREDVDPRQSCKGRSPNALPKTPSLRGPTRRVTTMAATPSASRRPN